MSSAGCSLFEGRVAHWVFAVNDSGSSARTSSVAELFPPGAPLENCGVLSNRPHSDGPSPRTLHALCTVLLAHNVVCESMMFTIEGQ